MIVAFTGYQGQGKTYSMVEMVCRQYMQKGLPVLGNLDVTDPVTGSQAGRWDILGQGFEQLYEVRSTCIMLDEAPTWLGARDFEKNSTRKFFGLLAQARKRRNILLVSAQNFDDLDVWIRRQCQLVINCRVAYRHPWQLDPSGATNPWTGRVLHRPMLIRQTALEPRDANVQDKAKKERRIGAKWLKFDPAYAGAFGSWDEVDIQTGTSIPAANEPRRLRPLAHGPTIPKAGTLAPPPLRRLS